MCRNILITLIWMLTFAIPALAADTCDLAATLAEKGVKTFASNKAEGLKLLIRAKELCSEPAYSYNLGIAYYQYGRAVDALPLLQAAVAKDGSKALWLNNLAALQLEQGLPAGDALKLAEKAAQLSSDEPAIKETLAQARYADGREVEALKGLASESDALLVKTRETLVDRYLASQLQRLQKGEPQQALAALQQVAFLPQGARTHALVLARLGRGDEALSAIGQAQKIFPNDSGIREAAGEVGDQVAAGLYADYQSGKTAQAVQQAKGLAESHPQVTALKTAYDKLLEALLADATTIAVPEAGKRKSQSASAGASDALLAGIGSASTPAGEVDLRVDVDQNIPTGKKAGRDDVAVVIGNRTYGVAGTPNVDYALRDAAVMRQYLEKTLGFDPKNILYVENATYAGFAQIFGRDGDHRGKLNNYVVPGKSQVFVYYVGHGAPDPESGDAYFVPVDADPQFLRTSGYRLQTFYDNLAKLPAKSVTVVLDSCFSGNSAGGMLFKGVSSIALRAKDVAAPKQLTVLASSRDDQMSNWYDEKRHSLFTYYFLKGIGGEADKNGDRRVTVAEMETYLDEQVPRMARRLKGAAQAPQVSGDRSAVLADLR